MKPALKRAGMVFRRKRPPTGQPDEGVENKEESRVGRRKGNFWSKLGSSKSVPGAMGKRTLNSQQAGSVLHETRAGAQDADIVSMGDSSESATNSGVAPEPTSPVHPTMSRDADPPPHTAVCLGPTVHSPSSAPYEGITAIHSLQGSQNMRVETLEIVHAAGNVERHSTSYIFQGPVFAIGPFLGVTGKVGDPCSSGVMVAALYTSGLFFF